MNTQLMIMALAIAVSLYPVLGMGGHVPGQEMNVVVLDCEISSDKPYKIYVYAVSSNTTSNPMPTITEGKPCGQALHELLTAGFEIADSNLETYRFVLIRADQATHGH